MKATWWHNAVVYEIYCKSFCDSDGDGIGDLQGVISKLSMLKELGINTIWFTPIYRSPQVDNGYDIADYQDIDPDYGTLEDFREMLALAHSLGIRVLMDMVLNHTSDQHKWFREARKSKDNPYRDYYVWRDPKPDGSEPNNWGNYFLEGKGSAWEFDETTGQYYLHYYSARMPDLNWENPALREEIYKMMRWWLDMGVDGFRLDVINAIKKPEGLPDSVMPPNVNGYVTDRTGRVNEPGIHELLQGLHANVFSHYDIMTVGETAQVSATKSLEYTCQNRRELDSLYHFEICNRRPVKPTVADYKRTQKAWSAVFDHNAWVAQHLSNHDFPRHLSRLGNDTQYRVESAKLLATLTHTLPGMPYVYQGEEIGMTNVVFPSIDDYNDRYTVGSYHARVEAGEEPEAVLAALRPLSRDNARTPYQWDATANAGFTSGTPWLQVNPRYAEINLAADRERPDSIFAYYQKLIAMRKENPAIIDGLFQLLLEDHDKVVMYLRKCARQTLLVVANFSDETVQTQWPEELRDFTWERILTNREDTTASMDRSQWLPWEAEVYQLAE